MRIVSLWASVVDFLHHTMVGRCRLRRIGAANGLRMTPEQHVLACALAVERMHGDQAPLHVASEIGRLVLLRDWDGVEMWRRIAGALDSSMKARKSTS